MEHRAVRTHVSEWTPSQRETECRQSLLPAEAECTSILWARDSWEKKKKKVGQRVFPTSIYFGFFIEASCLFSRQYLPSWVPIHTVPAVWPKIKRHKRLCEKRRLSERCSVPKLSLIQVAMISGDNTSVVQNTFQNEVIWGLQPIIFTLTYGGHSTDAESRSWGREAELIQYCVGPCRIDHCNIAAEGRARNDPHRTLAEKDGYGVWKDEKR